MKNNANNINGALSARAPARASQAGVTPAPGV